MRYDSSTRKAKYVEIQGQLRQHRIECGLPLDYGQSDSLDFKPPVIRDRFQILRRRRGWFLLCAYPFVFRVPNAEDVVPVCLALLKGQAQRCFWNSLPEVVARFRLEQLDITTWDMDEFQEQYATWSESGWQVMTDEEHASTYDQFRECLTGADGALRLPKPSITWNLPTIKFAGFDHKSDQLEETVTFAVLDGLRACTFSEQHVLVFDVDHPSFKFYPHKGVRRAFRDYWAKPVWPDGDTWYYLKPDMTEGIYCYWEGRITVFGTTFVGACRSNLEAALGLPLL